MPSKTRPRNDLARALTFLRELKGWGQKDLAAASGISFSSIQKIELGDRKAIAGPFAAIVMALEVDVSTVDKLVALIRSVRGDRNLDGSDVGKGRPRPAPGEMDEIRSLLRSRLVSETGPVGLSLAESRRRAPELWVRFERYPHRARRALVLEAPEFQEVGFCELLCDQSRIAAGDSAKRALQLAELAVLAAERVVGEEGWCARIQGYCGVHLANALRVGGTLPAAEETFGRAAKQWQGGAANDPGLFNEARVLSLEASLRLEKGEPREAVVLFDRALAIDRWGETVALLLNKSKALEKQGDFVGAIAVLRQAAPMLDGEREARKEFALHVNLALNLCHLGQHRAAEQGLPKVRALALRLGNRLDALRVCWLEARVAAGLGRVDEAVAGFERLRAGFIEHCIPYDVALVTLELAELHASVGRTAEVKALARASAPMFDDQGVHREAQRALNLFRRAAEEERLSVALIRSVLSYLERAQRDPQLRYQELA